MVSSLCIVLRAYTKGQHHIDATKNRTATYHNHFIQSSSSNLCGQFVKTLMSTANAVLASKREQLALVLAVLFFQNAWCAERHVRGRRRDVKSSKLERTDVLDPAGRNSEAHSPPNYE